MGQNDRGVDTDRPSGARYTTTLRNEPTIRPNRAARATTSHSRVPWGAFKGPGLAGAPGDPDPGAARPGRRDGWSCVPRGPTWWNLVSSPGGVGHLSPATPSGRATTPAVRSSDPTCAAPGSVDPEGRLRTRSATVRQRPGSNSDPTIASKDVEVAQDAKGRGDLRGTHLTRGSASGAEQGDPAPDGRARRTIPFNLRPECADGSAMSDVEATRYMASEREIEFVDLDTYGVDPTAAAILPPDLSRRHHVVAVKRKFGTPIVAMADPDDLMAVDSIRAGIGRDFISVAASPEQIDHYIEAAYHVGGPTAPVPTSLGDLAAEIATPDDVFDQALAGLEQLPRGHPATGPAAGSAPVDPRLRPPGTRPERTQRPAGRRRRPARPPRPHPGAGRRRRATRGPRRRGARRRRRPGRRGRGQLPRPEPGGRRGAGRRAPRRLPTTGQGPGRGGTGVGRGHEPRPRGAQPHRSEHRPHPDQPEAGDRGRPHVGHGPGDGAPVRRPRHRGRRPVGRRGHPRDDGPAPQRDRHRPRRRRARGGGGQPDRRVRHGRPAHDHRHQLHRRRRHPDPDRRLHQPLFSSGDAADMAMEASLGIEGGTGETASTTSRPPPRRHRSSGT